MLRVSIGRALSCAGKSNYSHIILSRPISTTPACLRGPPTRKPGFDPQRFVATLLKPKKTFNSVQTALKSRLLQFTKNPIVRQKASGLGVRGKLFTEISENFVKAALAGSIPRCRANEIYKIYSQEEGIACIDRALLSAFYNYAEAHLPENTVEKFNSLRKLSDLRFPNEWFPEARQMQRKVYLHVGPTNSGKTYRALKRLESAESGIYCGPLRLLAHEIFEKMNDKGIQCNLLTGEERREVSPYAPLTSSTVEMASLNKTMDVAVIDEIQMIADPDRGWAWTQALLGLKAKEIHLCGEASAVPLVQKICDSLDEEVIVNEYSRLTPYKVNTHSLKGDLTKVRKGDCVVAFSRSQIFSLKEKIEAETGLKCAVAYGALPPETRALQAKAFNDPSSGFDVLVASDAVGMGLNLNIKRIVFTTVTKHDGKSFGYISIPQLKQIAGRAGRFGTAYDEGEVTTLKPDDLHYVQKAVQAPIIPLVAAGLQPPVDILELFAMQLPNQKFSGLLQKFEDLSSLNGDYFLCNYRDQKQIADRIEKIKLPLRDRYQFVTAPVNTRNEASMDVIEHLASEFSANKACTLDEIIELPNKPPTTAKALSSLEASHKTIMLYMWLSVRYPDVFTTPQKSAFELKTRCEEMIDQVLKDSSISGVKMDRKGKKASSHRDKNEGTKKQKKSTHTVKK